MKRKRREIGPTILIIFCKIKKIHGKRNLSKYLAENTQNRERKKSSEYANANRRNSKE
jgi:hypothetical protein